MIRRASWAIAHYIRNFPLRERMGIATHVIGATTVYLGGVYGIARLALWLGGPAASAVAASTSALFLLPFWLLWLGFGGKQP